MSERLVSILMPTFRRPGYLKQALASAVGQTYRNIEIIVSDNASGDETSEVVRSFGDSRIVFLQSPQTVSAAENGSACLKRATGEYCTMLSDDDFIDPRYIGTLAAALDDDPAVSAAYSGGYMVDGNGQSVAKILPDGSYTLDAANVFNEWCNNALPIVTLVNMLVRTSLLREVAGLLSQQTFPEGHNSDNALMVWMALRGRIFFTDQTAYYYRVHVGNTCMRLSNWMHLAGDAALVGFIREQQRSLGTSVLNEMEWRTLHKRVPEMLAKTYFHRALTLHFSKQTIEQNLADITFRPVRVFGWRIVVRMLWQFGLAHAIGSARMQLKLGTRMKKLLATQNLF